MRFLKKSIPVFFAVILAVMVMIVPAFAASVGATFTTSEDGTEEYTGIDFKLVPGTTYVIVVDGVEYSDIAIDGSDGDYHEVFIQAGDLVLMNNWNEGDSEATQIKLWGYQVDADPNVSFTFTIEEAVMPMPGVAALMSDIGTMFKGAIGWIGNVAAQIGSHPILLFCFLLPVIGLGVGLFKRISKV